MLNAGSDVKNSLAEAVEVDLKTGDCKFIELLISYNASLLTDEIINDIFKHNENQTYKSILNFFDLTRNIDAATNQNFMNLLQNKKESVQNIFIQRKLIASMSPTLDITEFTSNSYDVHVNNMILFVINNLKISKQLSSKIRKLVYEDDYNTTSWNVFELSMLRHNDKFIQKVFIDIVDYILEECDKSIEKIEKRLEEFNIKLAESTIGLAEKLKVIDNIDNVSVVNFFKKMHQKLTHVGEMVTMQDQNIKHALIDDILPHNLSYFKVILDKLKNTHYAAPSELDKFPKDLSALKYEGGASSMLISYVKHLISYDLFALSDQAKLYEIVFSKSSLNEKFGFYKDLSKSQDNNFRINTLEELVINTEKLMTNIAQQNNRLNINDHYNSFINSLTETQVNYLIEVHEDLSAKPVGYFFIKLADIEYDVIMDEAVINGLKSLSLPENLAKLLGLNTIQENISIPEECDTVEISQDMDYSQILTVASKDSNLSSKTDNSKIDLVENSNSLDMITLAEDANNHETFLIGSDDSIS